MPELENPRLRLRMFTPDDLDAYHARVYGDAEVMRYMPGGKPRSRADTERLLNDFIAYWNEHPLGVWAVVEKTSGAFIGHAGLLYFENQPHAQSIISSL
jgi:RimJ/RimL family protein N-acetyltransferase